MNREPAADGAPQSLRVLIVEDSPRDAELVLRALRSRFTDVISRRVETGPDLNLALAEEPWQVVLSDFHLPHLNGFDALSIVRETVHDLPFIAVSGTIGEEGAVALLKAGADNYVLKDHLERLAEVVDQELHAAALRRTRQAAEAEIRATLYGLGDGVLATDAQGRVTRMNPAAEGLTGWTEAEAFGMPVDEVFRIVSQDSRAEVENPVIRVIRHGSIKGLASRTSLIARDGTERPIADSCAPIRDGQGTLIGVALVFRDETARHAAEAALQEREAFGRAVLHAIGAAIAVVDREGVITAVNHTWEQFAIDNGDPSGGASTGIGANYLKVAQTSGPEAEGAAEAAAGLQAMLHGRLTELTLEYPCHDPAGARRWFMLRATPLGAEQGGAVVAHLEITERKVLELRRELATNILATLNRTNDVTQLVRDVLGLIQAESDLEAVGLRLRQGEGDALVATVNGLEAGQAQGLPGPLVVAGQGLRDEAGQPAMARLGTRLLAGRGDPSSPYFTPHGSFWTNHVSDLVATATGVDGLLSAIEDCSAQGYESVALIPLRSGDAVVGLLQLADRRPNQLSLEQIEFLEGISASLGIALNRRRAAQRAVEASAELQRLLAEAEQSRRVLLSLMEDQKLAEAARLVLQEKVEQQQRLEVVGQLAAGVAHDFNNILTGITGYTELVIEETPAGSSTSNDLAQVLALSGRAADLTRQLLAFSRRQDLQPVALDLNSLIGELVNMLGRLIGEHIELRFIPGKNLGHVKADPGQLEQILMNFAVNARDAMPDGGELTIATVNLELDEDAARLRPGTQPGPYVSLTVADTGCGMAAAVRDRIFEPFYTTKEIGEGTGLGLATVYGIVQQHGGFVWVESEPGLGTTFTVNLPREAANVEAPALAPSSRLATGSETVLITEDEPAVLRIVRKTLERCGYRVFTAARPSEAFEVLAEYGPEIDLLLTDVVMPELNGRQLFEEAVALHPHLRALYMSGYTDDAFITQSVRASDTAFINKPFTSAELADAVRDVLDRPLKG